jgi:hypothetical protein
LHGYRLQILNLLLCNQFRPQYLQLLVGEARLLNLHKVVIAIATADASRFLSKAAVVVAVRTTKFHRSHCFDIIN